MLISEVCWLGHDNTIDLLLSADGKDQASIFESVNKMAIEDAGGIWSISSVDHPDKITWTAGGLVSFKLGLATGIPEGIYTCPIIVTDPTNPEGIVWGEINITFK